ncbi:hypothetical protein JCM16161A_09860 [Vulcanisaeta sp. JCM 16161]
MLVLLVFVTGVVILHHCLGDCKFSVYRLRFVIEWFINYLGLKVSDDSGQSMDSSLNGVSHPNCGLRYSMVCE